MRKFIPLTTLQQPAAAFWRTAAPLFEEERDTCRNALVANSGGPFGFHWTRAGTALASNYHPIDPGEIEATDWCNQRLD